MPLFTNNAVLNVANAGELAWSGTAWTTVAITVTATGGSGVTAVSPSCTYKQMGKTLVFTYVFLLNFTTAPSSVSMSMPAGLTVNGAFILSGGNLSSSLSLYAVANGANPAVITSSSVTSGSYIAVSGTVQVN